MKLSKYLNVSEDDFKSRGIYDVSYVPLDEKFFIDIFQMKGTNIKEFETSYTDFLEYFSSITSLLQTSERKHDAHWKEAEKNLRFREFQGIFLGYSKTVGKGNGIGTVFAKQMANAASIIIKNGVTDPEAFLFTPFLEENIGFDRISDMVVSILFDSFAKYTERICKELKIKKNLKRVIGKDKEEYILPWYVNKGEGIAFPILFCPKYFTRRIPGNFDWENPFDYYMDDGSYKHQINNLIIQEFGKIPKKDIKKEDFKKVLVENKTVFSKIVENISNSDSVRVSLKKEADFFARLQSHETKKINSGDVVAVADYVCEKFKFKIEDRGYWKSFYQNGYHLNEMHIQSFFYFLADSICESFGTDIFSEHHIGDGRVDFRIGVTGAKPVLVEIKLSSHSHLFHGFEKQLPGYLKAENAEKGIYLVVKVMDDPTYFSAKKDKDKKIILEKNKSKIDNRIEMLASKNHEGKIPCDQVIVDALPRMSKSKV